MSAQAGSASFAAATAASSSARVESGRIADCSPVAGLKIGAVRGLVERASSPPIAFDESCASSGLSSGTERLFPFSKERNARPLLQRLQNAPSVSISTSISDFSMISGGDMAMMSPVVRIRMPFSKPSRKAVKARLVGSPAIGSSSIAPTSPRLRMSMTCGRPFSECSASSQSAQVRRRGSAALVLVGFERREAGGPGHRVARNRCSRGRTRSGAPGRS